MKLTWARTKIGGQTKPYDFAAYDGVTNVGRIYRHDTSERQRGNWYWSMYAFGRSVDRDGVTCTGIASSKPEAAQMVERTYAACLEKGSAQ